MYVYAYELGPLVSLGIRPTFVDSVLALFIRPEARSALALVSNGNTKFALALTLIVTGAKRKLALALALVASASEHLP